MTPLILISLFAHAVSAGPVVRVRTGNLFAPSPLAMPVPVLLEPAADGVPLTQAILPQTIAPERMPELQAAAAELLEQGPVAVVPLDDALVLWPRDPGEKAALVPAQNDGRPTLVASLEEVGQRLSEGGGGARAIATMMTGLTRLFDLGARGLSLPNESPVRDSGTDNKVYWDIGETAPAALSPDGGSLVAVSHPGRVHVLDAASRKTRLLLDPSWKEPGKLERVVHTGRHAVLHFQERVPGKWPRPQRIVVWDLAADRPREAALPAETWEVRLHRRALPDGRVLMTLKRDLEDELAALDPATGEVRLLAGTGEGLDFNAVHPPVVAGERIFRIPQGRDKETELAVTAQSLATGERVRIPLVDSKRNPITGYPRHHALLAVSADGRHAALFKGHPRFSKIQIVELASGRILAEEDLGKWTQGEFPAYAAFVEDTLIFSRPWGWLTRWGWNGKGSAPGAPVPHVAPDAQYSVDGRFAAYYDHEAGAWAIIDRGAELARLRP